MWKSLQSQIANSLCDKDLIIDVRNLSAPAFLFRQAQAFFQQLIGNDHFQLLEGKELGRLVSPKYRERTRGYYVFKQELKERKKRVPNLRIDLILGEPNFGNVNSNDSLN